MNDGFRKFSVAKKVAESEIITSFYLKPVDGEVLWSFQTGQYLTLKVPTETDPVLKTYSLSCGPAEAKHHRITVKRETKGVGSCWLHDSVAEGDTIEIAPPRGSFVLNEQSQGPVILLSGGVGITPLLSMLHQLSDSNRDVWFIHACENGSVHAMHDEVERLAENSRGRIRYYAIYQNPTDIDAKTNLHSAEGFIDKTFLQSVLPIDNYDAYMCGPTPFMVAMYQLLGELGLPKNRIQYEFFGKATSLEKLTSNKKNAPSSKTASKAPAAIASLAFLTDPDAWAIKDGAINEEQVQERKSKETVTPELANGDVVFQKSELSVQWNSTSVSLLSAAEDAGLTPAFSCRAGICSTCSCKLIDGEVTYFEEPLITPKDGEVLICCAKPVGRVVLDI